MKRELASAIVFAAAAQALAQTPEPSMPAEPVAQTPAQAPPQAQVQAPAETPPSSAAPATTEAPSEVPAQAAAEAAVQAPAATTAQVPAAPEPRAQGGESTPGRTLRPVVVTPTPGVEQPGFDVPASVDVIEGETVRNSQLQVNLSEPLVRVPGVVALNRQNYAQDIQISSRGFGARSTFGVRGLRLFSDGIPATAPDGQGQISHFDLASVDRIEVLRGPFSVLYGNSSGGVISLFTADGGPQTIAEIATAFGSNDTQRYNARLSGQEGALQYNMSATEFRTDGWREHSAAERTGFNGKFKYTASEDTRITFVLNGVDMPNIQDPLGLTRAEMQANPRQATPTALQFNTRKSVDQVQAGAILEQRLSAADSFKLTGWNGDRSTQQFQAIPVAAQLPPTSPGGVIDLDRDYQGLDGQWVHRTRWWGRPFTFTAGMYGDELKEHRLGYQNFVGSTLGVIGALRRDEDNRVRSFDQYAQGEWSGERFSFTAGLRHSRVSFDSQDHYLVNGNDSGSVRYSATTPALGLVFHATDALNLYAAYGRGFETPTFNELAYRPNGAPGLNFNLNPAKSRQWELGAKAELARGWRANAAVYQARTEDEIVVLSNVGGRSTYQNAGQTLRRGFEAELNSQLTQTFSMGLVASWIDATYDSDFLTCTTTPCTVPTTRVAAGSRIPGIPRTTGFGELVWRPGVMGAEVGLEWNHLGRIYVDDRNTDFASRVNLFNLRASLAQRWNRWSIREFVRVDNLADKRYVGSVIVNEGNRRFFEPGRERNWLVGLNGAYTF